MMFIPRMTASIKIDHRSMALFRIVIGLTLIWDLIERAHDMEAHYLSQEGVLPIHVIMGTVSPHFFSIYFVSSEPLLVLFLFCCSFISYTCLCIGYRTKLSSCISWLLLMSLH